MSETGDETSLTAPLDLMVTMAEMGAQAQSALLQAEMEALARMIPGIGALGLPQSPPTDAEVESGFDNMPV